METLKNYLEFNEYPGLPKSDKTLYHYWSTTDRYYLRQVTENVLNTFPANLRRRYVRSHYNAMWDEWIYFVAAASPETMPIKEHVTALAVDQVPDKRYQDLGVTYGDLARNFRNFHNVLRYLTSSCDMPSDEEIIEMQSALFDIKHILGTIVANRIADKEKQSELALPTAKVGDDCAEPCPEHGRGLMP